jgi:putative tricarboxylic transport membrane protein
MLATIFYGASYGGRITAILMRLPGEASSAVTVLDGYPMAQQGRAGVALSVSAISSFVGGIFATALLVIAAPALTRISIQFGPPEYFALALVALSLVTSLVGSSALKGLVAVLLGLLLGMVGIEFSMGVGRFTFGVVELLDGVDLVPAIVGLVGLSEVFVNLEREIKGAPSAVVTRIYPTLAELRSSFGAMVRGSVIGSLLGILPGGGVSVASFAAYAAERRVSKTPEQFGRGSLQGLASPEAADNAASNAAFIPLFTLGIPSTPTVAVLMGALMIHGLTPGPRLFVDQPVLVWTIIASFIVGNVILLALNLPLVRVWAALARLPFSVMYAIIMVSTVIGAYAVSNSAFDIGLMAIFGLIGYALTKLDVPLAPLLLAFILSPLAEQALRQSMEMSQGDATILVTRPIALGLLIVAATALLARPLRRLVVASRSLGREG